MKPRCLAIQEREIGLEDELVKKTELHELEHKLAERIRRLDLIQHNNAELAHNAAWGTVPSLRSLPIWGMAFLFIVAKDWVWWVDLLIFLAAFGVTTYVAGHAVEQRLKEGEKLLHLDE